MTRPTASAPGDVTLDMLKEKMSELLKKGSAKAAQDLVRANANGAASLSSAAAVDYPALYAALVAAVEA